MLLHVFVIVSIAVYTDATTTCFECTDVPHPGDCQITTICSDKQKCFVNMFITTGGLILYNTGCESSHKCSMNGKRRQILGDNYTEQTLMGNYSNSISKGDHSKRADIPTCEECCDGDFCNNDGCGTVAAVQPARGPMCYSCNYERDPASCRHAAYCEVGEVCMLTERNSQGLKLYWTACIRPLQCNALLHASTGKRQLHLFCHVCCVDDFCNDKCPQPATIAPLTTTAKMTSMPPTTYAMTTQAMDREAQCKQNGYSFLQALDLCFKFHFAKQTWEDAAKSCVVEGGYLAMIKSQGQWDFLKLLISADHNFNDNIYVGARDVGHGNHTYIWPDGSHVTIGPWMQMSGHVGASTGRCIYLNRQQNYDWSNSQCNMTYQFICTKW